MKQLLLLCVLGIFAFSVTACNAEEPKAVAKTPVEADLMHGNFVLESVNGKAITTQKIPNIEFVEGFRVVGAVCNNFTGQGELKDNKLIVARMASTKMLCHEDEINKLEYTFGQMLMEGAGITLDGPTLTLNQGETTLVYKRKDWVQ